jgi:hypothetical protein
MFRVKSDTKYRKEGQKRALRSCLRPSEGAVASSPLEMAPLTIIQPTDGQCLLEMTFGYYNAIGDP